MRKFLAVILGGRPMTRICYAFTNAVNGKPVYYFDDRLGRQWLAEHAWSRFRVSLSTPTPEPRRER